MARKRRRRHRTTPVPTSACGRCGQVLDHATGPDHDAIPEPGDITLCIRCGTVHRFGPDMELIPLTREELDDAFSGPEGIELLRARILIESQLHQRKDHPERFN